MLRKSWILAALLVVATPARAEETVSVAIGGHTLMAYLPFALAYEKGYFKEAGLGVRINDFKGGAQAAEALVGGSADICIGAHEHTLPGNQRSFVHKIPDFSNHMTEVGLLGWPEATSNRPQSRPQPRWEQTPINVSKRY